MGLFYSKTSFYKGGWFFTPPRGISVKNKVGSRRVKNTSQLRWSFGIFWNLLKSFRFFGFPSSGKLMPAHTSLLGALELKSRDCNEKNDPVFVRWTIYWIFWNIGSQKDQLLKIQNILDVHNGLDIHFYCQNEFWLSNYWTYLLPCFDQFPWLWNLNTSHF